MRRCKNCGATSGSTTCDVTGFACVMEGAAMTDQARTPTATEALRERLMTEAGIYTNCRGPLNANGCVEVMPVILDGTVTLLREAAAALLAAEQREQELREALNKIAAWTEGELGGHMDEPASATIARAALAASSKPPATGEQP